VLLAGNAWDSIAMAIKAFQRAERVNREFFKFGPFSAIHAQNRAANSIACEKIPYAMKQGIFRLNREFFRGVHP
jgi:hypothetical protein